MSSPDTFGLADAALPLLRDLIHEHLGIHFEPTRLDALRDRLGPLVIERGFGSFLDYYYLLKYDPSAAAEWTRVMDALSVPETYFWREVDQVRAVVEHVVPQLLASLGGEPLRIWSIPCATGEEPLTIAMLLDQGGWFGRGRIEIHAADASPAAIERAKSGLFKERAFRSLPPDLRTRYFTREPDGWRVDPSVMARIASWRVLNLMSDIDTALMTGAPIVFCRNVLIYFSESGIRRVIERFARVMPSPGYLCVGASESLLKLNSPFVLEEIGGAFVYVKKN